MTYRGILQETIGEVYFDTRNIQSVFLVKQINYHDNFKSEHYCTLLSRSYTGNKQKDKYLAQKHNW